MLDTNNRRILRKHAFKKFPEITKSSRNLSFMAILPDIASGNFRDENISEMNFQEGFSLELLQRGEKSLFTKVADC